MRRYAEDVVMGGLGEHLTSHNRNVWTLNHIMQDVTWYWSWEWIVSNWCRLNMKNYGSEIA